MHDTSVPKKGSSRLPFIDFARGIVMVLMAWDHVNGFWNPAKRGGEGVMGMRTVYPDFLNFILRFITHYCAPTFIFLAGTGLALSASRRLSRGESQKEITLRMIKRGCVLLLLEAFVVSPAFGGSPLYFGVIACIGACFIIFSVFRRLPSYVILILSIVILLGHPFLNLDWIPSDNPFGWYLHVIIHEPNHEWYPFTGLYPIIPWLGVMGLGWCFGIFLAGTDMGRVGRLTLPLVLTGVISLVLWFVVRLFNGYGNLVLRTGNTLEDWLFVAKYPPSLAFLLWTLGGMCFFLALGLYLQSRLGYKKGITGVILDFGRVPLFFYCIHLWLYRLRPGWISMRPFNMNLIGVAVFWFVGLLVLWRLCLRYEKLKRSYPESLLQYI